jgi:stage V sporulation protein R
VKDGIMLEEASRDAALRHIRSLWGYEVSLAAIDSQTGGTLNERSTSQIGE